MSLSSNSSAVSVPGTVMVPAGSASAGFNAVIAAVSSAQSTTLTAAAGGLSKTFALALGAAVPGLTLQTSSVLFGDVNLNTPATQSVTLTSSGTAPLTLTAGAVTGAGFSISGISFPLTLNPSQTTVLDIEFDPTTTGAATGSVALTSNASPATSTIGLSGTGQTVSHQVSLTWNGPANSTDPAAGYNIYRTSGSSPSYQLLNAALNSSTSFTDTTVQNGSSYSYYVTTVDAQGNQSSPSNIASVSIP